MHNDLRLEHRHIILLFIAGVTLCVIFFFLGLFVGRYSAGQPIITAAQPDTWLPRAEAASENQTPSASPLAGAPTGSEPAGATPGAPQQPAESSAQDAAENVPEANAFFVQAAEFDSPTQAESFAATLRSRGFYSAQSQPIRSGAAQPAMYRVALGPYYDRESAVQALTELRNNGVTDVRIVTER
jgi:cell division protein FtsN